MWPSVSCLPCFDGQYLKAKINILSFLRLLLSVCHSIRKPADTEKKKNTHCGTGFVGNEKDKSLHNCWSKISWGRGGRSIRVTLLINKSFNGFGQWSIKVWKYQMENSINKQFLCFIFLALLRNMIKSWASPHHPSQCMVHPLDQYFHFWLATHPWATYDNLAVRLAVGRIRFQWSLCSSLMLRHNNHSIPFLHFVFLHGYYII